MAFLCGVMTTVGVAILVHNHLASLDRIEDALKRIADALDDLADTDDDDDDEP